MDSPPIISGPMGSEKDEENYRTAESCSLKNNAPTGI
jgi:hypothetical protein